MHSLRFLSLLSLLSLSVPAFAAPAGALLQSDGAALLSAGASVVDAPVPALPSADDPLAVVETIVQLVQARNWLGLAPVLLVLALYALRRWGGRKWPILETPRAGYVMSLIAAFGAALWASVYSSPGVGLLQVLLAAVLLFIAQDKTHELLKALLWPDGKTLAAEADAAGAALEKSSSSTASKINEAISK